MKRPSFNSSLSRIINTYFDIVEASLAQKTVNNLYSVLASFDHYMDTIHFSGSIISSGILEDWAENLHVTWDNTIYRYQVILFHFLHFAEAFGIKANLPAKIKRKCEYTPHIYTVEERVRLIHAADTYTPGKNCQLPFLQVELPMILRILDSCGSRLTETLSLQMKDFDSRQGIILFRNTKLKKERIVPIHPSLCEMLGDYCMAMGITATADAYLFPRKTVNEPLDGNGFRNHFMNLRIIAGIDVVRERKFQRGACAHDLRHTFACRSLEWLLEHGHDEDDIYPYLSSYMGHKHLYDTQVYLKYPTEKMDKDVDRYTEYSQGIINGVPLFTEDISTWEK